VADTWAIAPTGPSDLRWTAAPQSAAGNRIYHFGGIAGILGLCMAQELSRCCEKRGGSRNDARDGDTSDAVTMSKGDER